MQQLYHNDKADKADVGRIIKSIDQEKDEAVREHYGVLIRLVLEKNPEYIEMVKENGTMEDVLMEILKDRIDEKINTAVNTAVNTERQQTTVTHINDIMESFGVTIEKAMDTLKIPVSQRSIYAGLVGKQMQ